MEKNILLLFCLLLQLMLPAQDETVKKLQQDAAVNIKKPEDTIPSNWKKGGIYNLNIAQGALNNWAAGGDNFSLAVNSILNIFGFYTEGKNHWDNTVDFNFGYINTSSLGGRKNDDRLDILSKYGYEVSEKWNVATLVNLRSQLFRGYSFNDNEKVLTSAFLSPGYILTSLGMDYQPTEFFSVFISPITARWIIVKDDSISAKGLYGVAPGEHSATEIGAFVTAQFMKAFSPVLSYKSRLDLFSNYRHRPEKIDVFMTNIISLKLIKFLTLSWNFDLIYDDDVRIFGKNNDRPALQLKSLTGLGLQIKF
ncbi:MAG: DUF3078 domain-containing protein [Flavisolibacter sp.]|jgi:hypothetical protein|nr:DUF3078 domain-containing protein [Flavisolibacter sp.]